MLRERRCPAHLDGHAQYSDLGTILLGRGLRTIRVQLDPGPLEPGTSAPDYGFGPLVVAPAERQWDVTTVESAAAATLCGRTLDWVEAFR